MIGERFRSLLDPSDRYIVWDERLDRPATQRGRILAYSTLRQAERVARELNATGRLRRPAERVLRWTLWKAIWSRVFS
jgi:hypothetical protein